MIDRVAEVIRLEEALKVMSVVLEENRGVCRRVVEEHARVDLHRFRFAACGACLRGAVCLEEPYLVGLVREGVGIEWGPRIELPEIVDGSPPLARVGLEPL